MVGYAVNTLEQNLPIMDSSGASQSFADLANAHLDAAYNLARWLTRDPALAEDVVQDAMVRGLTYFGSFRGDNGRAWLLQIVRNVAVGRLQARKGAPVSLDQPDADSEQADRVAALVDEDPGPEESLERSEQRRAVAECVKLLPLDLRECLVLREWEDLSYKEIARIVDAPIGTVMSRLWRARQVLSQSLAERLEVAT
jgi:RNA polymerase sigma factor (sigma-70 family)